MKINKKRYLILLIVIFMLINIPIVSMASSDIDLFYSQDGNKITVNIRGERNRPVSITIKDDSSYYFIDQKTTDDFGRVSFNTILDDNKTYKSKVNVDGEVVEKDIVMKTILKPNPNPDQDPEQNPDKNPEEDQDLEPKPDIINNTASIYIKGYKGVILNKSAIEISSGESALDFTKRLLSENNIDYRIRSGYISEIDGQGEFDKGPGSGWVFSINGSYPNVGSDTVKIKAGDSIRWLYTHDLGEDVGAPPLDSSEKDDVIENPEIEESLKMIKDKSSSENEIEKAIDDMVKYFVDEKSNLKPKEIEKVLKEAKEASKNLLLGIDRIKTEKLAISIGNNAVEMIKALDRITVSQNDSATLKNLAGISRENVSIALSTISKINNEAEIKNIIEKMLEISMKIESRLSNDTLNPNKNIEKSIGINIIGGKATKGDIILPKLLLENTIKEDLNNIKIFSDVLSMEVAPDFLGADIQENISIALKNESDKVSIELKRGNEILKQTKKPVKIIIPYKNSVNNEEDITAVINLEDGSQELLGGKYNLSTKTLKFSSYKLGEFNIRENPMSFNDVSEHKWAKEAVDTMAAKGIIQGKTQEGFDPSSSVTRAEFSALIARSLKLNDSIENNLSFKDISKDKWYYKSVSAIFENGLVSGKSEDIFDPEGSITREEMTRIIGQILENDLYKKQNIKSLSQFDDMDNIAKWAEEGLAISVHNKVIEGNNNKFMPKENATRAETAVVLYKLYELIME